ncbi:hypothetical protein G6F65_019641 [Rhizopus arrhizus]|nr:hypothetical protein G6F65_019641 [Rhizopus arrhizus]
MPVRSHPFSEFGTVLADAGQFRRVVDTVAQYLHGGVGMRGRTGRHGLPWHTIAGGMLRNTELRAPTTASRPIVTPGPTNTSVATQAPSSTRTARSRRGKSGWPASWSAAHR